MLDGLFSLLIVVLVTWVVFRFFAGLFSGGRIKVSGGGIGFLGSLVVQLIMGSLRLAGALIGWMLRGAALGSVAGARSLGRAAERRASRTADAGIAEPERPRHEPPRPRRPSSGSGSGPVIITKRHPDGGTEEVWRSGQ